MTLKRRKHLSAVWSSWLSSLLAPYTCRYQTCLRFNLTSRCLATSPYDRNLHRNTNWFHSFAVCHKIFICSHFTSTWAFLRDVVIIRTVKINQVYIFSVSIVRSFTFGHSDITCSVAVMFYCSTLLEISSFWILHLFTRV